MLFHYHLWTPRVEETEKFYASLGFQVSQRIGKKDGEFESFAPPLDWDDFRDQSIQFRIIEMKRGATNITFGYGKKVMFDHIGFLVSEEEKVDVLERAEEIGLTVQSNERRTFIHTPYGFRIELQDHFDAIQSRSESRIHQLNIETKTAGLEEVLQQLFNCPVPQIVATESDHTQLTHVNLMSDCTISSTDPNGIQIILSK